MKKVVVTGATSMIGIATIQECLKRGISVIAIVREGTKRLARLPKSDLLEVIECSLEHLGTYRPDIHDVDVFYHFAWGATLKNEGRFDAEAQEPNIRYALDAVRLAQWLRVRKFVGAGSQMEYGPQNGVLTKDTPAAPVTAYGIAKYAAGRMAAILCEALDMSFVWGRILSVYGPHDNEDTLIRYLIESCLSGKTAELTPCEQIWDYLYEDDAGRAFYAMGASEKANGVYCVGCGKGRSLRDYVKEIQRVCGGGELFLGAKPYGRNQIMHLEADISHLVEDTGWKPTTSFFDGIKRCIESVR